MKTSKPGKTRLDVLLVERGLAPSRERAQGLLLAGTVCVNGTKVTKAGAQVSVDARIEVAGGVLRYASRGGLKLEGALDDFGIAVQGKVCLDVGSSNGGFTDCLLQRGAAKVYAVDVTVDQLDWKLRQDPRVVMVERNARYLRPDDIAESVDLLTVDVSFISATKILPALPSLAAPKADFLILIKPQFELAKRDVGKGGIVRDAGLRESAIERVAKVAVDIGLQIVGVLPSKITGAEGNQEFFLHAMGRD